MLQISSKKLSPAAHSHLRTVQARINAQGSFKAKVVKARAEWNSKSNGKGPGKSVFTKVKKTLISMCVGTELCNYCEHNEATDIEHILPKSFFPEHAFDWDNYLLACKTCNTGYKLDKLSVFNPLGSKTVSRVKRTTRPPTNDSLFINPRKEDPTLFFSLVLETGIFNIVPIKGTRDFLRADYTLNHVLELNRRNALAKAREIACQNYFTKLQLAADIHDAATFPDLEAIVNNSGPFIAVDHSLTLATQKRQFLDAFRDAIRTSAHPTVWKEMQRQHPHHPRLAALFARLPDALTW